MTKSLADILHEKNFEKPSEVDQIKQFVRKEFSAECTVDIRQRTLIVTVKGASLAGAFRMKLHELQKKLKTEKKITIRVGY